MERKRNNSHDFNRQNFQKLKMNQEGLFHSIKLTFRVSNNAKGKRERKEIQIKGSKKLSKINTLN